MEAQFRRRSCLRPWNSPHTMTAVIGQIREGNVKPVMGSGSDEERNARCAFPLEKIHRVHIPATTSMSFSDCVTSTVTRENLGFPLPNSTTS